MTTKSGKPDRRGGKRAGSGRKIGAATAKTREIANAAVEQGRIPLDQMLFNMMRARELADAYCSALAETLKAEKRSVTLAEMKQEMELRSVCQAAAREAAPYVHPRLNAIEHSGGLHILTHEQALEQLK